MELIRFALVAIIAIHLAAIEVSSHEGCTKNPKVKYTKLTLQWSPGVCQTGALNCKRGYKAAFAIHGLWPTQSESVSPSECCNDQTFNAKKLAPLRQKLDVHWPSLNHMENEGFWRHEWNKHGTCATQVEKIDSLYQYFDFAVKLAIKLSPEKVLAANKIIPNSRATYQGSKIVNALSTAYGSKIRLNCAQSKNSKFMVVTELSVCLDNDLKLMDCPYQSNKCLGSILYPAQS